MQILHSAFFYIIATVALISALGVVIAPRVIYGAVSVLVMFLSVSGIFILLNADFVGLAQVMVYAVGIVIMIIFAIMLTCYKEDRKLWIAFAPRTIISAGCAFCLFLIISASVTDNFSKMSEQTGLFNVQKPTLESIETIQSEGTANLIGKGLFTKYVLPFEILSVLLLALTIGSAIIAKKDTEPLTNPTTTECLEEEDV